MSAESSAKPSRLGSRRRARASAGGEKRAHHPWRENIEALVMAVVVALLFKYFILEISKIPSGSMQPTLMGSPEARVFDRVLVDKLSLRFRDPKRFEIVVFKHPLERSRVMVKRLVGMPDEELKIEFGDLWVRPSGSETWSIVRRPESVQEEMWRALEPDGKRSSWSVVRGGKDWKNSGRDVVARGEGRLRFRADSGPITDRFSDGYPPSLMGAISPSHPELGRTPVGDVRVSGEVRALSGTERFVIELTEGRRTYEFRVPGPAAPADEAAEIRVRDSADSTERVERAAGVRLAADRRVAFAAENLDDRLTLALDGEAVLALDIEPSARQEATITLGIDGAGGELEGLEVERDIHYLPPEGMTTWTVAIPPGHYVMIGDNTHDSADSRLWEAKTFLFDDRGASADGASARSSIRGNFRTTNENPTMTGVGGPLRFRDEWGEIHWFAPDTIAGETLQPVASPFVPRELIVGRAIAVFWPLKPMKRLWRIGWLH